MQTATGNAPCGEWAAPVLMWAVTLNPPCELIGSGAKQTTKLVTVENSSAVETFDISSLVMSLTVLFLEQLLKVKAALLIFVLLFGLSCFAQFEVISFC